jgi:hypothetical protein
MHQDGLAEDQVRGGKIARMRQSEIKNSGTLENFRIAASQHIQLLGRSINPID